jgi:hypothetical protein
MAGLGITSEYAANQPMANTPRPRGDDGPAAPSDAAIERESVEETVTLIVPRHPSREALTPRSRAPLRGANGSASEEAKKKPAAKAGIVETSTLIDADRDWDRPITPGRLSRKHLEIETRQPMSRTSSDRPITPGRLTPNQKTVQARQFRAQMHHADWEGKGSGHVKHSVMELNGKSNDAPPLSSHRSVSPSPRNSPHGGRRSPLPSYRSPMPSSR